MSDSVPLPSPNQGKQLIIEVDGKEYARYPIKTPLVTEDDDIMSVVKEAVTPFLQRDDIVAVSEKIVAIAQGRAFPVEQIWPSSWARFLSRLVSKPAWGIGIGSPETMELAIREAGLLRILVAGILAIVPRFFGIRGLFYVIADKNISAIDGPTPYTIPPYNHYAKLPPKDPDKVAKQLSRALSGVQVAIIDANDLGQRVLGAPDSVDRRLVEKTFADNPLGQGSEQTPVALVRRVN
ncbi:MAG: coenzyme F420-0:L-glutamate ligase [Chloroflexi bacterium]|nr:coenzyme F420-0:L-glutamate ligase [Chloroflexota bacterium]